MNLRFAAGVVVAAASMFAAVPVAVGQATPAAFEKVSSARASSIVTIKFILKVQNEDHEQETPGVMIEKDGLVLASNLSFGGFQAKFGGEALTPSDIKVLVGDDTQGVEAKIVARDSDLQLIWLQIEKPASGGYEFVDFEKGATPTLGEPIWCIDRLGKFFDRAATVTQGEVISITARPRKLYIPSGGITAPDFGIPVFNAAAAPVGVMTVILPEKDEVDASEGGLPQVLRGVPGLHMILPWEDVVAATKRAKEAAASGKGEPEAKPSDATPAGEKPAGDGAGEK